MSCLSLSSAFSLWCVRTPQIFLIILLRAGVGKSRIYYWGQARKETVKESRNKTASKRIGSGRTFGAWAQLASWFWNLLIIFVTFTLPSKSTMRLKVTVISCNLLLRFSLIFLYGPIIVTATWTSWFNWLPSIAGRFRVDDEVVYFGQPSIMNQFTASTPYMRFSSEQFSPSMDSMESMAAHTSLYGNVNPISLQPHAYASEGRGSYSEMANYEPPSPAEYYEENNMPPDVSLITF